MKILLIEDDLDDIELLQEALTSKNVKYELTTIYDGSVAIKYIRDCRDCPDIIVLDFNLPKVHGREVMLALKAAAALKEIPLLILTTSSAKEDIEYAYKHGADKYLIKPVNMAQINEMAQTVINLARKIKV